MADENAFDNDLNAIMGIEPTPAPAKQDNQTPANPAVSEKVYEAAGRKWKGDDLAKSYDSLAREMGSRNKDWQELKDLRELKSSLNKDPEFARYFRGSIEAYQKMRDAGTSQGAAAAKTGLPPEVVQKLEKVDRLETLADSIELEREESQLVKKYKLDDETLKKVEDYSLAHKGWPLEASYKQMMFDLHQEQILARKEQEAAKRKEVSRTSGATPANIQPSAKGGPSLKSDADWRKAAGTELSKYYGNDE